MTRKDKKPCGCKDGMADGTAGATGQPNPDVMARIQAMPLPPDIQRMITEAKSKVIADVATSTSDAFGGLETLIKGMLLKMAQDRAGAGMGASAAASTTTRAAASTSVRASAPGAGAAKPRRKTAKSAKSSA